MASPLLASLTKASGVHTVLRASRDVKLLFFQRFVRLFAYGTSFIIIVNFLKSLQIADTHVGWFMTLTMLGDVVISLVLSLITDQVGRRKVLIAGALLMASSGVTMAMSSTFWILLLASVFGVISPA
jgi:predicted MFS family arabinose efflux permease